MKGKCPRCGLEENLILFEQKRYVPNGVYVYTWQYYGCSDCNLVFMEIVHTSSYPQKARR